MSAGPATLKNIQRGEQTHAGWTQVYTYEVFTTDGTDDAGVVLTASGLPSFGSASSYDPLARVSRLSPLKQETGGTNHWHVEVEYSRETGNQEDTQQPPTSRRVQRDADTKFVERAVMKDRNGEPILTSAKTPFNPPLTISVPHPVVTFQRWEDSFTTALIKQYAGKVNSSTYGDYDAGWVMCTKIAGSERWEQDADGNPTLYWLVTYEFEACYDEQDTFDPFPVFDCDFWFLDAADSDKRKPIYVDTDGTLGAKADLSADAVQVPSPIPLTSTGTPIAASGLPSLAHYLNLELFNTADFNDLNLPVF